MCTLPVQKALTEADIIKMATDEGLTDEDRGSVKCGPCDIVKDWMEKRIEKTLPTPGQLIDAARHITGDNDLQLTDLITAGVVAVLSAQISVTPDDIPTLVVEILGCRGTASVHISTDKNSNVFIWQAELIRRATYAATRFEVGNWHLVLQDPAGGEDASGSMSRLVSIPSDLCDNYKEQDYTTSAIYSIAKYRNLLMWNADELVSKDIPIFVTFLFPGDPAILPINCKAITLSHLLAWKIIKEQDLIWSPDGTKPLQVGRIVKGGEILSNEKTFASTSKGLGEFRKATGDSNTKHIGTWHALRVKTRDGVYTLASLRDFLWNQDPVGELPEPLAETFPSLAGSSGDEEEEVDEEVEEEVVEPEPEPEVVAPMEDVAEVINDAMEEMTDSEEDENSSATPPYSSRKRALHSQPASTAGGPSSLYADKAKRKKVAADDVLDSFHTPVMSPTGGTLGASVAKMEQEFIALKATVPELKERIQSLQTENAELLKERATWEQERAEIAQERAAMEKEREQRDLEKAVLKELYGFGEKAKE